MILEGLLAAYLVASPQQEAPRLVPIVASNALVASRSPQNDLLDDYRAHLVATTPILAKIEYAKSIPELIEELALEYGADPDIAHAIARAESGERNIGNPTSTAFGPFQIVLSTWKKWNCKGSRFSAEDSIRCAMPHIANGEVNHWSESAKGWIRIYTNSELQKSAAMISR